jgi:hypothetical protein
MGMFVHWAVQRFAPITFRYVCLHDKLALAYLHAQKYYKQYS